MKINRRLHRELRLQNLIFVTLFLLLIGLLGWLSNRYHSEFDWTAAGRNSLTADSRRLLAAMDGPVRFELFIRPTSQLREPIVELLDRYRRAGGDVELLLVDPDTDPQRVRELGVERDGELIVSYGERSERPRQISESAITNALQRLARQGERWVVFLTGHGERDPYGEANHDLGSLGAELTRRGLTVQTLNLGVSGVIPDNTTILVLASPQIAPLPGEVELVADYVEQGGNLLWLIEPDEDDGLEALRELLGLTRLPGVAIDPRSAELVRLPRADYVLVAEYPRHPVTQDLSTVTLFPGAAALEHSAADEWQGQALLQTLPGSWTETGGAMDVAAYDEDADERPGPLTIGFALVRSRDTGVDGEPVEQRVAVIGDGDYLANQFVGNGGNLDLGMNLLNWLGRDDRLININPKPAPDLQVELSDAQKLALVAGYVLLLPAALLAAGVWIWLRRRRS